MSESSPAKTLLGYGMLALLGILVTCAVFAVFVAGPNRGATFYVALGMVCAAELVFFAHLANSALTRWTPAASLGAVRIQIHALIVVWLLVAIVVAIIASHPERQDTHIADRVLVIYALITFCFFAAAYFLYAKHYTLAEAGRQVAAERSAVHQFMPDMDASLAAVRGFGEQHPAHAVAADRTHKKLETVRFDISGIVVSERLVRGGGDTQTWCDRLADEIDLLRDMACNQLGADADPAAVLANIGVQVESVRRHLRDRPDTLII